MKKIQYLLVALVVIALSFTGCKDDFLTTHPEGGVLLEDQFAQLPDNLTGSIMGIYSLLYEYGGEHDEFGQRGIDMYGDFQSGDMAMKNETYGWFSSYDRGFFYAYARSYMWTFYYGIISRINISANAVKDNVQAIDEMAANADDSVKSGIKAVENLKIKANETSDVTKGVIVDIEALAAETSSIGNIIETINDIASQTNLLSLNASIEAARAGEAGKGFAVVAEEIRKLAEQSAVSAGEIGNIITSVTSKTEKTAAAAKHAEEIVAQQEEAVSTTLAEFNVINENVKTIADHLKDIGLQVAEMEKAKVNTLSAVEGISAVSEEAAASSAEVQETAQASQNAAKDLNDVIKDLRSAADSLTNELKSFKL